MKSEQGEKGKRNNSVDRSLPSGVQQVPAASPSFPPASPLPFPSLPFPSLPSPPRKGLAVHLRRHAPKCFELYSKHVPP